MAVKTIEVMFEAIYKEKIKQLQVKLKKLQQQEIAIAERSDNIDFGLDLYIQQRQLKAYINNYRIALDQLKRYGKYYIGQSVEENWLIELTAKERKVFLARFTEKKTFEEIGNEQKVSNSPKIYETAYRKVIAHIQHQYSSEIEDLIS